MALFVFESVVYLGILILISYQDHKHRRIPNKLLLCLLIVVHELGHFIVGRLCGIGVVEFSVGFGPKLFGWRRKNTGS